MLPWYKWILWFNISDYLSLYVIELVQAVNFMLDLCQCFFFQERDFCLIFKKQEAGDKQLYLYNTYIATVQKFEYVCVCEPGLNQTSLNEPSLLFTVWYTVLLLTIILHISHWQCHSQLFITFCERHWPKMRLGKTCGPHYSLCILVLEQINVQKCFYIISNTTVACHHSFFCLHTENVGKRKRERERRH